MENEKELSASGLAIRAAGFVKQAQEQTDLSLMEIAAMFRIAAAVCDECNAVHERALLASKMRGWAPGK